MINDNNYSNEEIDMLLKSNRELFEKYCEKAYAAIVKCELEDFDKLQNPETAKSALLRMLGLFEENEQFEKCKVVRDILAYRFPGEIAPKYDYTKL
jgi:hypothetical protein